MNTETYTVENDEDVNRLRQLLRNHAEGLEFSGYETTKLVTAASELARNILDYADEGDATVELDEQNRSIDVTFRDEGPGIPDLDQALQDGFSGSTSDGLGIGLPGAKRLVDDFSIESDESGTRISITVKVQQQTEVR